MLKLIKDKDLIETVGQLREALKGVPDNMPITDGVGEPLCLSWFEDADTGESCIEVG